MTAAPTLVACRDDLADRFGRRIETEGLIEHRFLVAEQPVTFRFAGGRLVEDLTASFAHLPTHDDSGGLTVNCWVADPDDELPPLPQEAFPETNLARRVDPADASLRTHYDWEGRTILVHDLDTATAWRCCADPDLIPWWERAAPLRMSLAWHLDQNGSSFLHGAAVTRAEDAALIVGPGGSGKSTTALSCLLAGFGYLGDDYCASSADGERVHSVYGSAKLAPVGLDAVEGFETLLRRRRRHDRHPWRKARGVAEPGSRRPHGRLSSDPSGRGPDRGNRPRQSPGTHQPRRCARRARAVDHPAASRHRHPLARAHGRADHGGAVLGTHPGL